MDEIELVGPMTPQEMQSVEERIMRRYFGLAPFVPGWEDDVPPCDCGEDTCALIEPCCKHASEPCMLCAKNEDEDGFS